MKKNVLVLIFVLLFFTAISLVAQTKQLLNYQGRLTLKDNKPVPNLVKMDFSIWSSAEGGDKIWEELDRAIQVQDGIFNVALGDVVPFPENIFLPTEDRYLEIKVNGEKLAPRFRLTSAPYVVQPAIPRGGIIMWSGAIDQIPPGWALCDGKEYARTDEKGNIKTPDLRDRFLVGAGSAYSVGSKGGENLVTLTKSQIPAHNHPITQTAHNHGYDDVYYVESSSTKPSGYDKQTSVPLNRGSGDTDNDNVGWVKSKNTTSVNAGITIKDNTGGGQSHENRPPYYALAFIMKL